MAASPSDPSASDPLAEIKTNLRRAAKARRTAAAAEAPDAGEGLCQALLAAVTFPKDVAVSAYWPMRDEIDPLPAMRALHARGHPVALPVMTGKDRPLIFRAWHPDQELVDGGFGTKMPPADAPEVQPQILLAPMLAFDGAGYRLGYGGGFYDRTLAKLRGLNSLTRGVGLAFAGQRVEALPRGRYDQPLDMIVTESGMAVDMASGGRS